MSPPSFDDLFSVIAHASCGEQGYRFGLAADADLDDPMTRLGVALNVLLDDLEYRSHQAQGYLRELLDERTMRLRDAEQAVRRREEFISVVGHELNTPLMSLQLLLEGLRRGMIGGSRDELERIVELAERQGRKLATLVESLLGVGRATSEQPMRLEVAEVDIVLIAREVLELMSADLVRAGCALSLDAAGPVIGRWDRQRLAQVFTNVLANAIKFGKGRPIEVTIDEHAGVARAMIRDHGIGIAHDQLERVFDLFERGVPSSHYGGLGIGLFIVRQIVEAHGGRVRADSASGDGACITIELPTSGPPTKPQASDQAAQVPHD